MDAALSHPAIVGTLTNVRPAAAALTRRFAWSIMSYLNGPALVRPVALRCESLVGQRILITGASSGIGRATATHLASQGAAVMMAARRGQELALLLDEIVTAGGEAEYHVCDLTSHDEVDGLAQWVIERRGGVDILINNAGRSIRRPIVESFERVDDVHRMMAINYFAPVQLMMKLLPLMLEHQSGHIINVGTWTVPVGTSPRFAAYHSSKAALAAFGRCANAELADVGLRVTSVHYPLVHTAMSAPTSLYQGRPRLGPDEAAEWIVAAIMRRPLHIVPRYAALLRMLNFFMPRRVDELLLRWG